MLILILVARRLFSREVFPKCTTLLTSSDCIISVDGVVCENARGGEVCVLNISNRRKPVVKG